MKYNNPDIDQLLQSIKLITREGQFTISMAGGSLSDHVADIDLYRKGFPSFHSLYVKGVGVGQSSSEVKSELRVIYNNLFSAIQHDEELKDRFISIAGKQDLNEDFDEYQIFVGWKIAKFEWRGRDRVVA